MVTAAKPKVLGAGLFFTAALVTLAICLHVPATLAEEDCSVAGNCKSGDGQKNRYTQPSSTDQDDYYDDEDAGPETDKGAGGQVTGEDGEDDYYEDEEGGYGGADGSGPRDDYEEEELDREAGEDDYYDEEGEGEDEGDEVVGSTDAAVCRAVVKKMQTERGPGSPKSAEEVFAAVERCSTNAKVLSSAALMLAFKFNASFWSIDTMIRRGIDGLEKERAACDTDKCLSVVNLMLNRTKETHIGLISHTSKTLLDNHESLADVLEVYNITLHGLDLYPVSETIREGTYECWDAANEYPVAGGGDLTTPLIFTSDRPASAKVEAPVIDLTIIDDFISADDTAKLVEIAKAASTIDLKNNPPLWCFGGKEHHLHDGVRRLLEKHDVAPSAFYTANEISGSDDDVISVEPESLTGPERQCLRRNRSAVLGELLMDKGALVTATTAARNNSVLIALSKNVEEVMGLPDVHGDDWQITQYVKGATYTLHTDCLMSEELEDKPEGLKMDRLATVLVYLTTVTVGGTTRFERLDTNVQPIAGRAVVWRNLDEDGECIIDTEHSAMPVESDEIKIIAQRWYYKEAVNSLHMKAEAPAIDEYRQGTPNIVCDSGDPNKCRNYGEKWTFF